MQMSRFKIYPTKYWDSLEITTGKPLKFEFFTIASISLTVIPSWIRTTIGESPFLFFELYEIWVIEILVLNKKILNKLWSHNVKRQCSKRILFLIIQKWIVVQIDMSIVDAAFAKHFSK